MPSEAMTMLRIKCMVKISSSVIWYLNTNVLICITFIHYICILIAFNNGDNSVITFSF